jgi:phage FluMu protein Com
MRCPDCNKFVSYDEPQCELGSVEIIDNELLANVTVTLNCAECGTTLKDAEIETSATIEHTCIEDVKKEWNKTEPFKEGSEQYEIVDDGEPFGESRTQTIDRNGKPIKSSRYMKTFYGFSMESEIKCNCCGEHFNIDLQGEEQASGFNECC